MLERLLLIDDDDDELLLFEEALHRFGAYPVLCYAQNGQQALYLLANGGIDMPQIIFCDINMPVMDGWQFLKKIKSHDVYKHIPVVIYSTTSNKKEVALALELGAAYFFTKPVHYEQLKFKLQVIIKTFAPRHKEIS